MGNFSRELNLYFNRKSEVYNILLISVGRNAEEAELNGKEGITRGSFLWENTSLQYLTYLSVKKSEEAELNKKEGITRGSFQWEITSLGVLNWMYEFLAI